MAESPKRPSMSVRRARLGSGSRYGNWLSRLGSRIRPIGPSLLMLVVLVLVPVVTIWPFSPPDTVPASAPATTFSAARALPHLQAIAQSPHPVGSEENARVRDYLVRQLTAIGFQPEIQRTTVLSPLFGTAATVNNVLVRIPGTNPTRSVLVTAHYDSVVSGPGTGDNGVGIAAMLETLRALRAGPALRNDLIFLFNDGEEPGLLGSQAFVDEHPWAKDVGVVFDFDADSPAGRSVLAWTTSQDGWLVREIGKASPDVVASSFDNVDKREDAGNDLRVFAAAGLTGAHFDVVAGTTAYHNARDSLANLDERRLQDHGNTMLTLARHFGDLSIGDTRAGNDVFFTTVGTTIIHFPTGWVLPMALVSLLGMVFLVAVAFRKRRLAPRRLGVAFLVVTIGVIALGGLAQLSWQAILATHPESKIFSERDFYGRTLYLFSFFAIAVTLALAAAAWLDRRFSAVSLALGAATWLAVLALALTSNQSAAYLLVLPLMAGVLELGFLLLAPEDSGQRWAAARFVALLLGVVVMLGVTVPMLYRGAVDGLEEGPALPIGILVLLLSLLMPQLALVARVGRRWLPATAGIVAAGLLVLAITTSGQSASRPRPDTLMYLLNADTGEAFWASTDSAPDAWTKQVLTESPEHRTSGDLFGVGTTPLLTAGAPVATMPGPDLILLGEQRNGDERTLHLRLVSPRQAYRYYLEPGPGVQLVAAGIGDKPLVAVQSAGLRFDGLSAEGYEITLRVRTTGPVRFTVADQSSGFPRLADVALSPRPDTFISSPDPELAQGDPTIVWRTYEFE